jgi:hypothetical protein
MTMRNEAADKALETTNLILGVGLACAAFVFTEVPSAAWNAGIVGVLIACCSAAALYRYRVWPEWSNMTLGYWTVVAPFVLGFAWDNGAMWTHVLVGICVAAVATKQLMGKRETSAFEQ